jgi:hypothetical protein
MVGPVGVATVDEEVDVTLVALVEVPELLKDVLTDEDEEEEVDADELTDVEDAEVALYA